MPIGKIAYKEKCIVEAENKDGKSYVREISLVAQEVSRKIITATQLIFLKIEFKNGQCEERENIVVSDTRFVRDYFLKKIASAIDLVHPARRIKIIFPESNKYLKMHRAYCQNCGNLLKEFYGFYEGRIEERCHCKKLTVLRRNPKESR
ncbi:MAG: hypothetical protein PHV98_04265 [Candidatus Omnitrophica bacterium]|nr:hypothetical protein [Candidatus Omnitrophota bacterium]